MPNTLAQVNIDGNLFEQLPTYAKFIFGALIFLSIAAITMKYWLDLTKYLRKKKKVTLEDLHNHSFFTKCEMWAKYKVNEMYFGDEIRNRLFRTILSIKIEQMCEKMEHCIHDENMSSLAKKAFEAYVFKAILEVKSETQENIRRRILDMYPEHGTQIHELVMNNERRGFNAFNQITDNYTDRLIQIICESDMYDSNYEKMEMILDALKASLGAAFPHIEAAFKGFNGELDQMVKKRNSCT